MSSSSIISDDNIDPTLLFFDEMRKRGPKDIDSVPGDEFEPGGTPRVSAPSSNYGDDDEEDYILARQRADTPAAVSRPVADFCQQLKRRKLLRPESEAELDVYAVR